MRGRDFGVVSSGVRRIKGAFVRVYDVLEGRQIEVGMSDSKGRYQLPVKPGKYLLGAYAQGFDLAEQPSLISKGGMKFIEVYIKGNKVKEDIELKQI
jgi:hypothetical protein